MKSPEEMRRLLDDSAEVGGELRLGLERMSSNVPSAAELASLAARLPVGPSPAPANGGDPVSKTLLKIAAGAGVSGVVLWALLRGGAPGPVEVPVGSHPASPSTASHDERPAPNAPNAPGARAPNERATAAPGERGAPAPSAAAEETPLAVAEPPSATPEVSQPGTPRAVETPRSIANPSTPPERAASKPTSKAPVPTSDNSPAPARAPTAAPPSETALLRDARLALNGDAARALALTEQHRREYPNGGFAQEREVIAITALAKLGRTSEARTRAERFRSAYPTSPYTERVDRAVPR